MARKGIEELSHSLRTASTIIDMVAVRIEDNSFDIDKHGLIVADGFDAVLEVLQEMCTDTPHYSFYEAGGSMN